MASSTDLSDRPAHVGSIPRVQPRADHIRRFHGAGFVLIRLHAMGDTLPNGQHASGKEPVVRGWQKATSSPPLDECLAWRGNYGLLLGPSKNAVLDVEPPGLDTFPRESLPKDALVIGTPSGGYHAYLDLGGTEQALGQKLDKKIKLGARAELHSFGSQVVGPGCHAYSVKAQREGDYVIVQDGAPISDVDVLRRILAPFLEQDPKGKNGKPAQASRVQTTRRAHGTTAYGRTVLEASIAEIAAAVRGATVCAGRHDTFIARASKVYALVAGGEIAEDEADAALRAAYTTSMPDELHDLDRCLHDARGYGFKKPRSAPNGPWHAGADGAHAARKEDCLVDELGHGERPSSQPNASEGVPECALGAGKRARLLTDCGNNERLIDRYGDDLRFSVAHGWLVWGGKHWIPSSLRAATMAKDTVRSIWREALLAKSEEQRQAIFKHACASEKKPRVEALLGLARSDLVVESNELDSHPFLLNVLNGTLDLRSGVLLPHSRKQLITKLCPVSFDPHARLDEWDEFLKAVTDGDKEREAFLRRHAGLCLSGDDSEDVVLVLHGPGGTGKSTYTEALRTVLGGYARAIPFDVLLVDEKGGHGPRPELAKLAGTRLVVATEVEPGRRFNTGLIKSLSGGDMISARGLYKDPFEYCPQFKLVLGANDLPTIRESDTGAWRRMRVVPFEHVFPEERRDTAMRTRLRQPDARVAILAWMFRGFQERRGDGLGTCAAVESANWRYRRRDEVVALFVAERCERDPSAHEPNAILHARFLEWSATRGGPALPPETFGRRMGDLGFEPCSMRYQGRPAKGRRGIRLRNEPSQPSTETRGGGL